MHRCGLCNIDTELFFCPRCGNILSYPQFIKGDNRREDMLRKFLNRLVQEANRNNLSVSSYMNAIVLSRAYLISINDITSRFHNNVPNHHSFGKSFYKKLQMLSEVYKAKECQITITGRIGSGKSTLTNALLKQEVALQYSAHETSSLTKYRYSKKSYVRFSYYKTSEWNQLWESIVSANQNSIRNDGDDYLSKYNDLNADEIKSSLLDRDEEIIYAKNNIELKKIITDYTSNRSPFLFFIKEVEIGLSDFPLPHNISIVETLGINDPIPYRAESCRQSILSATVLLLCIPVNSHLFSEELQEISNILSLPCAKDNRYIIGTKYDIPRDFVRYWEDNTKYRFINVFLKDSILGKASINKDKIFPVSAEYYNIIQQAKSSISFFCVESEVDYLAEVLYRCLGCPTAYKYGEDGESLNRIMSEYIGELEAMSNVPNIVSHIISAPILNNKYKNTSDFKILYKEIQNGLIHGNKSKECFVNHQLLDQLKYVESKIEKLHNETRKRNETICSIIRTQ